MRLRVGFVEVVIFLGTSLGCNTQAANFIERHQTLEVKRKVLELSIRIFE
jgi:hypothetical protein